ncbi:CYTH domain-containing protein [Brumimicrobium mesophilum]|uniref:CYTH domain-containing protein n=1 Tax=Brumimicrobium mesophilum TaxID=392717 RepID=UPI000D142046|nr:CYTH domain-containing protein [Brumimicrobium mesophilum]
MGLEIERKFLVDKLKWEKAKPENGLKVIQGYILKSVEKTVRVRTKGNQGFITIKGKTKGISRSEFEYTIPYEEAVKMLEEFCGDKIIKTRYELTFGKFVWEVDEFESPKTGLILAEIELSNESEHFLCPDWLGKEVSGQSEYYNANMI